MGRPKGSKNKPKGNPEIIPTDTIPPQRKIDGSLTLNAVTTEKRNPYAKPHVARFPPPKNTGKPIGRPKGSKVNWRGNAPTWLSILGGGKTPFVYTEEFAIDLSEKMAKWLEEDEDNIFICDFCEYAKIPYTLPDKLCDKYEIFKKTYEQWKTKQRNKICKGAINRKYDGNFSKFMLACNHGMRDVQQVQLTGANDDPITLLFGMADDKSKQISQQ